MQKNIKFRSDLVTGLLKNEGDYIGNLMRSLPVTTPITLCQGYGVGGSVPLRMLAYAVPVLQLARQLPDQAGVDFYWATRGVMRANPSYNPAQLQKSSEMAKKLLASYVNTFHPVLQNRVRLLEDMYPCERAEKAVSWLLKEASVVAPELQSVASFVAKRGGTSALRYMVEHALYMRDPLAFEGGVLPELVAGRAYPDAILTTEVTDQQSRHHVMIGGPSEKVFWKLRQELLKRLPVHALWTSHQFFTGVGELPPYHPQPSEPYADVEAVVGSSPVPCLREVLAAAEKAGRSILEDWIVLLQDAAGVERFTIFADYRKNKCLSKENTTILEEGLIRLFEWIRLQPLFCQPVSALLER